MTLESLVQLAAQNGASDLHLESGLPAALRVRGTLKITGAPLAAQQLLTFAQELIDAEEWTGFLERKSYDCSRVLAGVRCRVNAMRTARGIGFSIRLLAAFQATLDSLNLHPDLKRFIVPHNGLVLVCGPTGSGKSSTLAALIQEINLAEARHIITIESPIEYSFSPVRSYIRQREIGRDTPSFEQAILDALREDPDVLMIGEMREPEIMRLTLNAAETGHLVLATVHSGTCVEALQRIVSAFPAEIQSAVSAQIADCLVGVLAQRLQYRPDLNIRIPHLEVLHPSNPIKAHIRNREFYRIASVMETGAEQGMWTFDRYAAWMQKHSAWNIPTLNPVPSTAASRNPEMPVTQKIKKDQVERPLAPSKSSLADAKSTTRRIEIEPVEGGLSSIFKEM